MQSNSRPHGLSRRTAVKITAIAGTGLAVGGGLTATLSRLARQSPWKYHFFSEAEAALVIELCEQVIPRDDAIGATDAGVIHFMDRQLLGAYARHQKTYRQGLAAFAKTCQQLHGQPFTQLEGAQKIALMKSVEAGKVPAGLWQEVAPVAFFRLLVEHTMQGFYGSPRHGGNRDYLSYKMLGVDYPQVIGQNRHQRQAP